MQLSVLRVFQAMLADKVWRKQKESAQLIQLATHVTRTLFARLVPDLMGPGKCYLLADISSQELVQVSVAY